MLYLEISYLNLHKACILEYGLLVCYFTYKICIECYHCFMLTWADWKCTCTPDPDYTALAGNVPVGEHKQIIVDCTIFCEQKVLNQC